MKKLIEEYTYSLNLLKDRIKELSQQAYLFKSQGKFDEIEKQNLPARIRLLYVERRQVSDIIKHLTAYQNHVQKRKAENKED